MSIHVSNLIKEYGTQKAVNDISFSVEKGQVLGFLGPNGAGKTTTMKIITCFVPQTKGKVEVCGFDVVDNPMDVRARIGYLPEHNPLYKDMYVKEYLSFVAGLHKVANKKKRVAEMIEMTGLGREQAKLIGALSKGYRQRVGLAQAMLHNPEVLILDEPTSGLDPNQLVEIRALIKQIGREKTVVFSTHIMQEVQAICDRVVIINKGEKVADEPIEKIQSLISGENMVVVEFKDSVNPAILKKMDHIKSIQALDNNRFQLISDAQYDVRESLFQLAVRNNYTILELYKENYSVEDVFQKLTK